MLALLLALQVTNCQWTANGWTCEQSKQLDYDKALQSGRSMVPEYKPYNEDRDENLRRRVGLLISQGKCADAIQLALKAGRLDLASQAKSYCSSQ